MEMAERNPRVISYYALCSADPTIKNSYEKLAVNSRIRGIGIRQWWATVERTPGRFDFTGTLNALRICKEHGKTAHVTITAGVHTPTHIQSQPGIKLYATDNGSWPDPRSELVQQRFGVMVRAFADAIRPFSSIIDFVHLSGPQCHHSNEIHLPLAIPKADIVEVWKQSISLFAQEMDRPLCLNLSEGYKSSDGIREAVADLAFKLLPIRLRLQHNALDGKTPATGFKTQDELLAWGKKGVVIGCEAKQPSNHPRFNGTFKEMVSKAQAMKLTYLSIYQGDASRL